VIQMNDKIEKTVERVMDSFEPSEEQVELAKRRDDWDEIKSKIEGGDN